jgi:dihydrolipoamide dehydrogenase
VPKKLAMIGAGVIGLEMGSVWRRLGAEVTILEAMPDFLAAADQDVAKEALKLFTKQGLNIKMSVKIGDVKVTKKGVSISLRRQGRCKAQKLEADRLIVSIGRKPNTDGLNAEAVGLQAGRTRHVAMSTAIAAPICRRLGNWRRGPWSDAGAQGDGRGRHGRRIDGRPGRSLQFRHHALGHLHQPEIAWVGKTEQQLKD